MLSIKINNVKFYKQVNWTYYVLACDFSRPLRDASVGRLVFGGK